MDETPIICSLCGELHAAGDVCCPACRRCPWCGTRIKEENLESCWTCGYPNDPEKVEEVKAAWNPDDPQHKSLHKQRAEQRLAQQFSGRINHWRTIPLYAILVILTAVISVLATTIIPIAHWITLGIIQSLGTSLLIWCGRQIDTGRWPWFLKASKPVASTDEL